MNANRNADPAEENAQEGDGSRWRFPFKMALALLGFFALFGVIGTGYIVIRDSGAPPPRPDRELDSYLDEAHVSGFLSIRVSRFGNLIYSRHQSGDRADDQTTAPIGNLEETLTALAIMILHDRNRLDVNLEAGRYLPSLPAGYERLTLDSLLTHTSGISPQTPWTGQGTPPPPKSAKRESVYAPANYRILEQVLTKVSGMPAHRFVEQEIIRPLNMDHTSYDPGLGWVSCAQDLATFEASLNLNPFVKMKTLLRSFRPPRLMDGTRGTFGYGWSVEDVRGVRMEQAGGLNGAQGAVITRFSEKNLAIVILSQAEPPLDLRQLGRTIGEIYLEREMRPPRHASVPDKR